MDTCNFKTFRNLEIFAEKSCNYSRSAFKKIEISLAITQRHFLILFCLEMTNKILKVHKTLNKKLRLSCNTTEPKICRKNKHHNQSIFNVQYFNNIQ